ncbi:sensor histidine kinase [Egicoccus sp. AB-alg2]|uniref:sensor histidine kinase n=1 Tax=Egicoccus sp. AB-alg2 TaxID=3242693 RepID=UPI00359E1DF1
MEQHAAPVGQGRLVGAVRPLLAVPRPDLLDVLVALTATAAAVVVQVWSAEPTPRDPDLLGVGLLVLAGVLLLSRRSRPVLVLVGVTVLVAVYLRLGYAGGAELPLLMAALYGAMAEGHRGPALAVLSLAVASSAGYRLLVDREHPLLVVVTVSLLVLVVLLGEGTRTRRLLRREAQERLRALAVEQQLETRAQLTAERLRVARELHDVLAHTITAIAVQAGAAADGLDEDGEAHRALRSMRAAAQEAMHQLGATIEVLRSEGEAAPRAVAPDLSDLDTLVGNAADAGVAVDVVTAGEVRTLPAAVELTAYRIVQEALTNVIRHARASKATVRLRFARTALHLEVEDDGIGPGAAGATPGGFGIVGMRERAQALGGTFSAGAAGAGGYRVVAALPTGEDGR